MAHPDAAARDPDAAANTALVRRLLTALARIDERDEVGERALWLRFTTREVVYHDDPGWPDAATHTGRRAVRERFESALRVAPGLTAQALEIVGRGDRVLVVAGLPGGGVEAAWVLRFEGGRVCEFRAHLDRDEARREAGLGRGDDT